MRTTISIDPELHSYAVARAKRPHYTDFSGYITKLIVDDLTGKTPPLQPAKKNLSVSKFFPKPAAKPAAKPGRAITSEEISELQAQVARALGKTE